MKAPAAPATLGVATTARLMGVSRRTVLYMLADGRLEGTRLGGRGWWKISRASIARLLAPQAGAKQ